MSMINVNVSDFTGTFKGINGSRILKVSKLHFLKYGMTAGMPLFGGLGVPSLQALSLAVYKAIGISCTLDFTSQFLKRSSSYTNLDPTEQANLSTWVGMAGTSLMADVILNVPRLVHAHALQKNRLLQVSNPFSRILADFIGEDAHNKWHVLEAKARQKKPSNKERTKWKMQAQTVRSINGILPVTQSYCYTRIDDPLNVELVDPPVSDKNKTDILIEDKFEFIQTYYRVLMDVLQDSETRIRFKDENIRFKLAGFDPLTREYIHIGLHEKVYKELKERRIPPKIEAHNEPVFIPKDNISGGKKSKNSEDFSMDRFFLASDGIAVVISRHHEEIEYYDQRYH